MADNTKPDDRQAAAKSLLDQLKSQRNGLVDRMRSDKVQLDLLEIQIQAIEPHAPKPEPAPTGNKGT